MMRTGAPRTLLRPLSQAASISSRLPSGCARMHLQAASTRSSLATKTARPVGLTAFRQQPTSLARFYASGAVYGTSRDPAREKELAGRIMASHPERVSAETSTTQPTGFANQPEEDDTDMMAGVRSDIKTIRETFALDQVPPEAYRIGLAGVLPYLATSTATVVCAFDFNNAVHNGGQGLMMTDTTAEQLLQILEPLQVGYGAVILSFLGAIHWGLEWAGYGGKHGYSRYAIGVLAPAVAWPTILLPVEYALIAQFLAFNTLYAVDANAASRGWVPPWYQTYRFILTFVVGASIVLSLIGRGQVVDRVGRQPSAADRVKKIGEENLGGLAKQGSGK